MNDRELYYEFANIVKEKLMNSLRGYVRYEVYPDVDTIIFKVKQKDFTFSYPVNGIATLVFDGKSDEVVENFKARYKKSIYRAFFKPQVEVVR